MFFSKANVLAHFRKVKIVSIGMTLIVLCMLFILCLARTQNDFSQDLILWFCQNKTDFIKSSLEVYERFTREFVCPEVINE